MRRFFHLFKTSKILSAYGTSLLGIASGLLTSVWLLREITKVIPAHDFGVYAYVMQICAYLPILQLGVDLAATRHIAQCLGRNNAKEANGLFTNLLRFNRGVVTISIVIIAAITAILWYSPNLIGAADFRVAHLSAEIWLAAGTPQIIAFMSRPYSTALVASECQPTVNTAIVIRTISTALIAFCFLKLGFYVFSIPSAEIITQVASYFVLRTLANSKCKWRQIDEGANADPESKHRAMMSLIKYGAVTTLGGMAWTVESSADIFILGYLTTPQVVATYVIWWRIPQMLFDLCTRLAFSAFPSFSHSLGASKRLSGALLGKVGDVSSGLATLALLGISIWLPSFVKIWIATGYAPQDSEILPFLMGLLVCLRTPGNLVAVFWLALARTGLGAALSWCQALTKVCLGIWLGREFGISGVVAASCVAAALQVVVICIHLYRSEILGVGPIVRFTSLFLLASCLSLFGVRHAPHVGWVGLAIGASLTTIAWSVVWLAIAWTGDLQINLRSLLASAQRVRPT